MALKEELTTEMHSEFLKDEFSALDIKVMGVYGATARGISLEDALKRYNISYEQYNQNINRVLSS